MASIGAAVDFAVARNGTLAYRPAPNSPRELVWLDRSGNEMSSPFASNSYDGLALSPDGRTAAVVVSEAGRPNIWLYRSDGTKRTSFAENSACPVWSPDGKQLAYITLNRGHGDIVVRPADHSAPEQLLIAATTERAPSGWSPDGKFIVFIEHEQPPANKYSIWTIPVGGPAAGPLLFLRTSFSHSQGVLSPDGKWMAYWSNQAGPMEVFVSDYPDHRWTYQVSNHGGERPLWRSDGRELFFLDHLRRVVVSPVTKTGSGLTFGKPQILFQGQSTFWGSPFATVDGRRFLAIHTPTPQPSGPQSLVVVLNVVTPSP